VFNRAGIDYQIVTGYLHEEAAWQEIGEWVEAARVVSEMRRNRVGILGHYYCGMLDVYTDLTQQAAVFGNHFELLEMCELAEFRRGVTDAETAAKIQEFEQWFEVSADCETEEIERAARTAVALDKLVVEHRLGAMYENIVTSVIAGNTLLTAQHVPVAGECEVKNVQAMKIMDLLGAGGSFSEFYLSDFVDDVVYLGHDGPAHVAIAEGAVGLVPLPLYHGKPGKGLSIQMTVKHGPVTLLSVVQQRDGAVALQVAEAESVPGPILQIGNTNSRYRFSIGAREFMNEWSRGGPAHHCAIGTGHVAGRIRKLGALLGIEVRTVC
jgi:L-arabinose isomerase